MYRTIQQSLLARIQAILLAKYNITLANLVVEQPPSIALGELALPVAFELAKRLRKAPRAIATELSIDSTSANHLVGQHHILGGIPVMAVIGRILVIPF